jgi:hypothetical protein
MSSHSSTKWHDGTEISTYCRDGTCFTSKCFHALQESLKLPSARSRRKITQSQRKKAFSIGFGLSSVGSFPTKDLYFSSVPTKVLYFSSAWCGRRKLAFPKAKKCHSLGSGCCQSGLDPHRRRHQRGEEGGLQPLPLGRGRATANRAWIHSICRRC